MSAMNSLRCWGGGSSAVLPWHAHYVGIPFADKGRDVRGADCWGLVRLVYSNELGIELPTYGEISAFDLARVAREIGGGKDGEVWVPVDRNQLRAFDVAVMRGHGVRETCHVGVMVDANHVLHVERGIDAVAVPLDHWTVRRRQVAFRRHRNLA